MDAMGVVVALAVVLLLQILVGEDDSNGTLLLYVCAGALSYFFPILGLCFVGLVAGAVVVMVAFSVIVTGAVFGVSLMISIGEWIFGAIFDLLETAASFWERLRKKPPKNSPPQEAGCG